ncbi:peroxiredoxin family protein [Helicobacter zhangjianzhongii]|uniref:Redoxin domain-containing protein n=1 Tax=Helicobacter zhangjianzhongii TaxID=2974574 RepID=A0ACC6FT97_9HELI|nr:MULTISPECIES: redoxin domain-containing protein [unclassified Helicobacter]MDL0080379.1 redoxin domain-containing protein [Helicobacter sp. CPD2-1]MDL0082470.1 redoxin domain-containing protein [Helicobacter sp. XJK30-2]
MSFIQRILAVCSLCLYALLITNCSSDGTKQSFEHSFQADDSSSYAITLNDESILLKRNGSKVDSVVLLVFLADECQACQGYYEHLNHLQANQANLQILGIFGQTSKDLQTLKKDLGIDFTLLQDTSKTPLLDNLLAQKQARANALLAAQNQESNSADMDSSDNAATASSQADNGGIHSEKGEKVDSSSTDPSSQSLESTPLKPDLPYFVLYDDKQHFYQDYEGIVPEEIFSSDIAQLAN